MFIIYVGEFFYLFWYIGIVYVKFLDGVIDIFEKVVDDFLGNFLFVLFRFCGVVEIEN